MMMGVLFVRGLVVAIWFVCVVAACSDEVCANLVRSKGYPCSSEVVPTADGYLLCLHHIPHGRSTSAYLRRDASEGSEDSAPVPPVVPMRKPVLLQHGLLQGSDTWLLNKEKDSLALVLADAGFDVWLGNDRASRWSCGHMTLNRTSREFWDWTFDEIAQFDVPAMVAHIRMRAGVRPGYVGHSQGTIVALAGLTGEMLPDLIQGAVLLSPIAYLDRITSPFVRALATLFIDKVFDMVGVAEFNINSDLGKQLAVRVCSLEEVDCSDIVGVITGPNCCVSRTWVQEDLRWMLHPTSVKNMVHLAQMIRRHDFRHFDYGFLGNLRTYGWPTPPRYSLSKIPEETRLLLCWGEKDALADPADVAALLNDLPKTRQESLLLPRYAHLDFILSTSAAGDVYTRVAEFLGGLWEEAVETQ